MQCGNARTICEMFILVSTLKRKLSKSWDRIFMREGCNTPVLCLHLALALHEHNIIHPFMSFYLCNIVEICDTLLCFLYVSLCVLMVMCS
jgi:hypothetical protein